jgi:hypothetical protein
MRGDSPPTALDDAAGDFSAVVATASFTGQERRASFVHRDHPCDMAARPSQRLGALRELRGGCPVWSPTEFVSTSQIGAPSRGVAAQFSELRSERAARSCSPRARRSCSSVIPRVPPQHHRRSARCPAALDECFRLTVLPRAVFDAQTLLAPPRVAFHPLGPEGRAGASHHVAPRVMTAPSDKCIDPRSSGVVVAFYAQAADGRLRTCCTTRLRSVANMLSHLPLMELANTAVTLTNITTIAQIG